jgi:SAM-dependent methyltransferase
VFPVIDGILNLLPDISDAKLLNEEKHWDSVADKGKMKIVPNEYISTRIVEDYRKTFEKCIKTAWPGTYPPLVNIADIGCGSGSAITYLHKLEFQHVDYVGIDVSLKIMRMHTRDEVVPDNWKIRFVKASANVGIFEKNSLDIVFSASSLHHLDLASVIEWVSNSLKPNGLLILNEPSSSNPFAKIGRKVVRDFHTKGEKPILPKHVKQIAHKHNLVLVYEKGLHYLTGSLQYLIGMAKLPFSLAFCVYHISRLVDYLITPPSWNYSFIQVYKKT